MPGRIHPALLMMLMLVIAAPAGQTSMAFAASSGGRRTIAASSPLTPVAIDSLRSTIRRRMAAEHAPSLAVAVARQGRIVWEEGFGMADQERGMPATAKTLYSIASISKPITATALMTLVERGKIDLERPANDYLGTPGITGLAGDASGATVRRLLSHTAGLPTYVRYAFEGDSAHADLDRAIARYAIAVYPPGRLYDYSNLGYGILGKIIERVSGRRYEDYVRDEVFVPLGMAASTIGTGAGIADAAVRYSEAGKPLPFYDTDHRGASGVYTSAHELIRFAMFQLRDHARDQKRILSDQTIESMQHVATPGDSSQGYGLGFDVGHEGGASSSRTTEACRESRPRCVSTRPRTSRSSCSRTPRMQRRTRSRMPFVTRCFHRRRRLSLKRPRKTPRPCKAPNLFRCPRHYRARGPEPCGPSTETRSRWRCV